MSTEKVEITVIKTKPLKSTTSVEGTLVQCSNNLWYAIITMRPSRNPWFMKAVSATSTGRTDISAEHFSMKCAGVNRPNPEDGVQTLLNALNGIEVPKDKIAY
jgi:hypothetical protein